MSYQEMVASMSGDSQEKCDGLRCFEGCPTLKQESWENPSGKWLAFPLSSKHLLHSSTCQRLIKQPWTPPMCCLLTRGQHSSFFSTCSAMGEKDKGQFGRLRYWLPNSSVKLSSGPWLTSAGTARTSTQLPGHRSTRNDDRMTATHPLRPPVQFPWMQGLLRHSFTCEKQLGWWGPSGHRQRKPFTSLMHVAPLRQGLEAHSSMSMLHLCPVKKGGKFLVKFKTCREQTQDRDILCWHLHPHRCPTELI